MARSTKGLYKRGNVWWITYFDALGSQRFDSSKSSNKKDAEKRLVDRRKEAHEGLLPAPPIKPAAFAAQVEQPQWRVWRRSRVSLVCHSPCGHFLLADRSS